MFTLLLFGCQTHKMHNQLSTGNVNHAKTETRIGRRENKRGLELLRQI